MDINVRAGDFVVDLGAGVGDFATLCAIRGAQVISVEAQRGFIPVIQRHLKLNKVENRIIVEWGLIGGSRGFFSDEAKLKQSSHYENQEPPKLELVSLLRKHGWERIDLLKMDIEGSEFALFESGSEWLPFVNAISMETHLDHGEVSDLIGALEKNGFETCHIIRTSAPERSANRIGFLFATRRRTK